MAFCQHCGTEVKEGTAFCQNCGAAQNSSAPQQQPQPQAQSQYQNMQQPYYSPYPQETTSDDSGNIGWGCLGCCIPVVGLILFLVWKDTKPKTAKVAGIGALISFIASVLFYTCMFGFGFLSSF